MPHSNTNTTLLLQIHPWWIPLLPRSHTHSHPIASPITATALGSSPTPVTAAGAASLRSRAAPHPTCPTCSTLWIDLLLQLGSGLVNVGCEGVLKGSSFLSRSLSLFWRGRRVRVWGSVGGKRVPNAGVRNWRDLGIGGAARTEGIAGANI